VPELQKLTPFLMFQNGEAEEAMTFYTGLFADGEVVSLDRKPEGGIQLAVFSIAGQQVRCIDSPPVHEFGFTPSVSLFVRCDSREELDKLWAGLVEGGSALMPLDDYGFGPFGWTNDRFGVSWQLSLA
jgi:predicted 3-demethylubiquinone-9 3-methyltransferase (glyoxalase superfamily)